MGHNYGEQDEVFCIRLKESVFTEYGVGLVENAVLQAFPEKGGFATAVIHAEIIIKPHEFEEVIITEDGQVRPVRRKLKKMKRR